MNATPSFIRNIGNGFNWLLSGLALAVTLPTWAEKPLTTIPFSEIGANATAGYEGDALVLTATAVGVRLHCGFQKLDGYAMPEGLWLESTKLGEAGRLRLVATTLSRLSALNSESLTTLSATGAVSLHDKLVRFTRPGLIEEYSVSADGLRQDFIITVRLGGGGDLCLQLELSGARVESAACGATLTLSASGRKLAYSRLRVEDALGRELSAHLEVLSPDRLAVSVADAEATYPLRIDPIFSDADWVSLNPGLPGANGPVSSIVVDSNGNLIVGGGFTFIGTVPARYVAKWDGSAWSALGDGMPVPVGPLALSGTNVYAGAALVSGECLPCAFVAKWDGAAWSTSGLGVIAHFASLSSLAMIGNDLYVGGAFTNIGYSVPASCIARWNGTHWTGLGSGLSGGGVYVLTAVGTNLYVGGTFTTAGGAPANRIAKWDGSVWSVLGAGVNTLGDDSSVGAIVPSGTNLFVGGKFATAGGVVANSIAKWDGSNWSALGSGLSGSSHAVSELLVSGTNLYVGGSFTSAGGVAATNLAKWDGSSWSALGMGMNNSVRALALKGTNLYAGGIFSTAGGVTAHGIARWDGSAWSAMGSGVFEQTVVSQPSSPGVSALAVAGDNLYVGGRFTRVGGAAVNGIAKWDGGSWSGLGSGLNDDVQVLAASGTNLYAGGRFTTAGGVPANRIAKWDGSVWSALGAGIGGSDPHVDALAVSGTNLFVGGRFTTAGGVPVNHLAKWNGSAWSALGSGMSGGFAYVLALAASSTSLYAGGSFTSAGGVAATNIAKWDGDAWSALGSGVNGTISELAVSGTELYAAGGFLTAGGVPVNRIAKWDGTTWSALGTGLNGDVEALLARGNDLYVGGRFTAAGGLSANHIARWDGAQWSAMGSGVSGSLNSNVTALASDDAGHLFVGGDFFLAGTTASPYLARANVGTAPVVISLPVTRTAECGTIVCLVVRAVGDPPPVYHWYFNNTYLLTSAGRDLILTNLLFSQSGSYTVVVSNEFGAMTSSPVVVNVIAPVERRFVLGVLLMGDAGSLMGVDCANSLNALPDWLPAGVVSLASTSQYWFDTSEPLPPQRFYRAWQTTVSTNPPSLGLNLVPALTLTGSPGEKIRVDGINALGPTDAWFTLDTVTLTNTSQLYFDVTAPGQPARLYRLAPSP